MKQPLTILAFGLAIALVCLGLGGCTFLVALGDAAIKKADQPQNVNIRLPELMKKTTP